MASKLSYLIFFVVVLCASVLLSAISGMFKGASLSDLVASGVGIAIFLLGIGRFGSRFAQNKLKGHIIGTLVVAALYMFAIQYNKTLQVTEGPRPTQTIFAETKSASTGIRATDAATLPPSKAGASCFPPDTVDGLGNTGGVAQTSFDLDQFLAEARARTAALQKISPEEVKAYRLAADQGQADAQYSLGELYAMGAGVLKDPVEAERLFVLAAKQGNPEHQSLLASMYSSGRDIGQDVTKAVQWYTNAAKHGYSPSQASLGQIYADGVYTSADKVRAHMWFNIADACGYTSMGSYRDDLERGMSHDQIVEATQRARLCLESSFAQCD